MPGTRPRSGSGHHARLMWLPFKCNTFLHIHTDDGEVDVKYNPLWGGDLQSGSASVPAEFCCVLPSTGPVIQIGDERYTITDRDLVSPKVDGNTPSGTPVHIHGTLRVICRIWLKGHSLPDIVIPITSGLQLEPECVKVMKCKVEQTSIGCCLCDIEGQRPTDETNGPWQVLLNEDWLTELKGYSRALKHAGKEILKGDEMRSWLKAMVDADQSVLDSIAPPVTEAEVKESVKGSPTDGRKLSSGAPTMRRKSANLTLGGEATKFHPGPATHSHSSGAKSGGFPKRASISVPHSNTLEAFTATTPRRASFQGTNGKEKTLLMFPDQTHPSHLTVQKGEPSPPASNAWRERFEFSDDDDSGEEKDGGKKGDKAEQEEEGSTSIVVPGFSFGDKEETEKEATGEAVLEKLMEEVPPFKDEKAESEWWVGFLRGLSEKCPFHISRRYDCDWVALHKIPGSFQDEEGKTPSWADKWCMLQVSDQGSRTQLPLRTLLDSLPNHFPKPDYFTSLLQVHPFEDALHLPSQQGEGGKKEFPIRSNGALFQFCTQHFGCKVVEVNKLGRPAPRTQESGLLAMAEHGTELSMVTRTAEWHLLLVPLEWIEQLEKTWKGWSAECSEILQCPTLQNTIEDGKPPPFSLESCGSYPAGLVKEDILTFLPAPDSKGSPTMPSFRIRLS